MRPGACRTCADAARLSGCAAFESSTHKRRLSPCWAICLAGFVGFVDYQQAAPEANLGHCILRCMGGGMGAPQCSE
eukprot:1142965-Pelagomonas_calceolata.AAC.3